MNAKIRAEKAIELKKFQACMFGVEQVIYEDGVEVSRSLIHRTDSAEKAQFVTECEHNTAMDHGCFNECFEVVYTDSEYWENL